MQNRISLYAIEVPIAPLQFVSQNFLPSNHNYVILFSVVVKVMEATLFNRLFALNEMDALDFNGLDEEHVQHV